MRKRDSLTEGVIGCVIRVHRTLGAGFLESIYRRAMVIELRRGGLRVEVEKPVLVYYRGYVVGRHRLDLLVEERLILELKAVEQLHQAHYAQVRSYMKATALDLALLVNFARERADYRRVSLPAATIPIIPTSPPARQQDL